MIFFVVTSFNRSVPLSFSSLQFSISRFPTSLPLPRFFLLLFSLCSSKQVAKIKLDYKEIDAIITTYDMVKAKSLKGFISRYWYRYVVLDEGHIIKNDLCQTAQACRALHSYSKVILTGTPLQNNLHELWSILNYLYPDYFEESNVFDDAFDITHNVVDKAVMRRCNAVLSTIMLRRLKNEVEKMLPKKIETVVECPLSSMQIFWYKSLLLKDMSLLVKMQGNTGDGDQGSTAGQHKQLSNLIMQLRKVANHPFQFWGAEEDPASTTVADLVGNSGKLAVLDKLLIELFRKGHRVCIFSQFTFVLDIIDDYCVERGWCYSRLDGSTGRAQRNLILKRFNAPESPDFLFLMSTRAGGMGLNIQSADTVILFDSDWNPQPDIQAMARVHRIGQKKTVHVYRLVCKGTIEERILARAEKKLYLDKMVNTGGSKSTLDLLEEAEKKDENNGGGLSTKDLVEALGEVCFAFGFFPFFSPLSSSYSCSPRFVLTLNKLFSTPPFARSLRFRRGLWVWQK